MANKQKSNKITIANFVAIVGIALLGIFTFMGHSYLSGGELAWDVIVSLGVVLIASLLLWFLIKAKGAENELDKWRKAEYATLGVYIIFAIATSTNCGTMHFFVVNAQKDYIDTLALNDLRKIDSLFTTYEEFENTALNQSKVGLKNSYSKGARRSSKLSNFLSSHEIDNKDAVETFIELERFGLLGPNYQSLKQDYDTTKMEITNVVEDWNTLLVASKAKSIEELAKTIGNRLTNWSQEASLPIVNQQSGEYDIIEPKQSKEYQININSLQFKDAIAKATGFSFIALLLILLIHILILFNYIVAYRTHTVKTKSNRNDDGGIFLE